ncbi:MAG TPA: DUF1116 domain-containing protein [Hyphomicrobiaceae bacterium]|nr:DUF1116 domain-containing protein [Hyphomicrobiaceae bacterium]
MKDIGQTIEAANAEALRRILSADPVLVDCIPASEAVPKLDAGTILHSGPPIGWDRMCGPMRGAVTGIAVFEGWASDLDDAERKAARGEYRFAPNHHYDCVGPMTGMTTRGQMLLVVENKAFGNRAYCAINEGLGKVMRFGGNDKEVLDRIRWLTSDLGPALGRALRQMGGIPLKALVARGLTMGDEMHQRNVACSSLLMRLLAPALATTATDSAALARCLTFIGANDQFFLNVAMAMGKAMTDPARGIAGSSVVTAMCRNGTDFGIRVSGTGDDWFTAPVEMPKGLYFPGYTEADANPDMGDSAIVETIGLGGFAMGASPAVVGFVGAGNASEAAVFTRSMGEICVGENAEWTIPAMDYKGVPTGIDVRLVVETGIMPTINTGVAHKKPGVGQVGAGIVKAPRGCFEKALVRVGEVMGV